jgi:hypothetical protein
MQLPVRERLGNQVHFSVSIILVIRVFHWKRLLVLALAVDFISLAVQLKFLSFIALVSGSMRFFLLPLFLLDAATFKWEIHRNRRLKM